VGTHIFIWLEFSPGHCNGSAFVGLAFAIADTENQARSYVIDKLGYNPDDWGPCQSYCLAEVSEIAGAVAGGG
jgi:hypothetical protein